MLFFNQRAVHRTCGHVCVMTPCVPFWPLLWGVALRKECGDPGRLCHVGFGEHLLYAGLTFEGLLYLLKVVGKAQGYQDLVLT